MNLALTDKATVDWLFDTTVLLLQKMAAGLGTSYQAVNILVYFFFVPASIFLLLLCIRWQRRLLRKIRLKSEEINNVQA